MVSLAAGDESSPLTGQVVLASYEKTALLARKASPLRDQPCSAHGVIGCYRCAWFSHQSCSEAVLGRTWYAPLTYLGSLLMYMRSSAVKGGGING